MHTTHTLLILAAISVGACGGIDYPPPPSATDADDAGVQLAPLPDASTATDAECTPVQHWNGYNAFNDCTPAGTYTQDLTFAACQSYFPTGCAVLDDSVCSGTRFVGGHSETKWIVWSWGNDRGTSISYTTPPSCPGHPGDLFWW